MIVVNGECLDPALIDEAFFRLKADAEARSESSCCERDEEFRVRAEDEVIEGVLLAQEAERRVPEPARDEVREALEATLREWREHGASWDLLEARRDELRGETVAKLRMDRFAESVWHGLPELDEEALRAWHEDHADEFRVAARMKVLHLIRFPEQGDPLAIYREMVGWRREVLGGASFAELAKAHTGKRDGGIDLGWIEHQRVLNAFEAMLFSLGEHEVSPVFFYEQALHLVWVEALEPERVRSFEEVADEVAERARAEQRREALHRLALELRRQAVIERID